MVLTNSTQNTSTTLTSHALVERARKLLVLIYPPPEYPSVDFDSARWDLRPISAPRGTRASVSYFCELDDLKKPLPRDYADMIKAMIVFSNYQGLAAKSYSDACRFLWAAISRRLHDTTFSWDGVITEDFEEVERIMKERGLSQGGMCKHLHCLNVLKEWLNENAICDGIEWRPNTLYPNRRSIKTDDDRQTHVERLPTRRAIQGLAEIYRFHAKEPGDRLLICAVGLLLVAGFRISELLSLPFDCWVSDYHRGRDRFGIRYWNRKARGGAWQWAIRWLSPMGAELARSVLDEINAVTASARNQAQILERDPSRVEIPGTEGREELTAKEVSLLLGVTKQRINCIRWEGRMKLTRIGSEKISGRPNLYLKSDVEAELLKRRGKLYTFDMGNGKFQLLSETLLIMHPGFLHIRGNTPLNLLVTHLGWGDIGRFLTGRKEARGSNRPSAFERFGIKEPIDLENGEARSSKMRSNMFRHWLNTLAHKSGMSVSQITMWMQRTNPSHTLVYLHSSSDIADLAREGIREGRYVGHHANEFNTLPQEDRDKYLTVIQTAHKTNTGICTANFGVDNCELHKTCELGCRFYLRDPRDENDSKNLLVKRQSLKMAIERIKEAKRGGLRIVSRQLDINKKWVAAIDQLLALEPSK
jgi:hypothetical protein